VERTSGVTASFIKELLRRAALEAAEAGRTQVRDEDLAAVLDELFAGSSALTRVLLAEASTEIASPGPHEWMVAQPHFQLGPPTGSQQITAQFAERSEPPGVESPGDGEP
jgi:hypothetical protein